MHYLQCVSFGAVENILCLITGQKLLWSKSCRKKGSFEIKFATSQAFKNLNSDENWAVQVSDWQKYIQGSAGMLFWGFLLVPSKFEITWLPLD